MAFGSKLIPPIGIEVDKDNVGLAKDNTLTSTTFSIKVDADNVGLAKDTTLKNLKAVRYVAIKQIWVSVPSATEVTILDTGFIGKLVAIKRVLLFADHGNYGRFRVYVYNKDGTTSLISLALWFDSGIDFVNPDSLYDGNDITKTSGLWKLTKYDTANNMYHIENIDDIYCYGIKVDAINDDTIDHRYSASVLYSELE